MTNEKKILAIFGTFAAGLLLIIFFVASKYPNVTTEIIYKQRDTVGVVSIEETNGLININTASAAELQKLSGIGPVISQAIVNYRDEHGGFKSIEEIKNVRGIGDKLFESISEYITV